MTFGGGNGPCGYNDKGVKHCDECLTPFLYVGGRDALFWSHLTVAFNNPFVSGDFVKCHRTACMQLLG